MFDTLKSTIGDIASGAVKDQRIALSHEQLGALDLKLKDALTENSMLRSQNAVLARRVSELEAKLQRFEKGPEGDQCPYCHQRTGKLINLKPHPQSLLAHMGTKIGFYECTNQQCGKSYDRQVRQ
jgi:regulator of replication initiation timing